MLQSVLHPGYPHQPTYKDTLGAKIYSCLVVPDDKTNAGSTKTQFVFNFW